MKNTKKVLAVALIMILVGSFGASLFHTSFFQVKVKKVVDRLKKMGKFDEEEFKNIKKKLVKKEK